MEKNTSIPMSELRAAYEQFQRTGIVPGTTELNMLKRQNATKAKQEFRRENHMKKVISKALMDPSESKFFKKIVGNLHWFRRNLFEKDCLLLLKETPPNFLGFYWFKCKK